MAFNTTTCHVLIHITRNRRVIRHRYNIRGTSLTPVEHHPYLGLELDNKLCWKQQLANVRSKGTPSLNMVRRNFYKRNKIRYKEPDLHKPCPPSVGIWKLSVGLLPTGSNPADRGCAEQSGTIRPPGLAENVEQ